MKPQHKSSGSLAGSSKRKTPLKSSNVLLNATTSQQSLSFSKVLVDHFMKLETDHTSIDPKKHPMVRRKTPVDGQKSLFKPCLKPADSSPLLFALSEATTPSAKEPMRSCQSVADGNEHFSSDVVALEMLLTDRLRQLAKDGDQSAGLEKQSQLYSDVFQQVIDKDKRFGSLLLQIKAFYDTWLKTLLDQSNEKVISHYTEQLKQAKHKLQQYQEERKLLLRKIEKLSRESMDLGQKLEECEEDYDHLKQKLDTMSQVDLEDMALDEKTWKYLVVENQSYHELFKKMQGEFRSAKEEQERLLDVIGRMKERGFPVEEVEDRSEEDEEDMEPLASGPEKKMLKPKIVPRLRLDVLRSSQEL